VLAEARVDRGLELDDPVADLLGHLIRKEALVEKLELAADQALGAVLPRRRDLAEEVGLGERIGERQLRRHPLPLVLLGRRGARVPPGLRRGEVQRAEAGYRDLLGRLPAIVYTSEYGAEGRWSYVSPGIETILGYSVSEWLADPGLWYACMHPDDRDHALAAEERSHMTGESLYSEYRLFARDGRVVWFRDEATVIHNEAGSPTLLAGVMLDVTTQRRAQDELELGYVVQRKLAEAASLSEGLRGVLAALGARFGWDACAFWAVDDRECAMRLAEIWHAHPPATEAFERASRALRFREGEGLPGRAWATGEPAWVEDVSADLNFPRRDAARESHTFGALVQGIVTSTPFTMRMAIENAN